jgi:hypothetical protein
MKEILNFLVIFDLFWSIKMNDYAMEGKTVKIQNGDAVEMEDFILRFLYCPHFSQFLQKKST